MENNSGMDNEVKSDSSQYYNKLNVFTVILGVVGFFVSLYALAIHLQVTLKTGGSQFCDINSTVSCSAVVGSSYGEIASIPLGAYGMTYFAIILSAAFMPKVSQINKKWLAFWEFLLGVIGLVSVAALVYISYFKLKMVCPTCTVTQIIVVIYAALKIIQFIQTRKDANLPKNDAFTRFMAVSLCLGIPPLAIGLIAPHVASYFVTPEDKSKPVSANNTQKDINKPTSSNTNEMDIKNLLMTFNKTNFVGNGEDYRRGNDNAKVVVQVFSDFGCPHCRIATEGILKAQDAIGLDKVIFVYRFFPVSNKCNPYIPGEGGYPFACSLAEASRCAGQQGKFWEFKTWGFSGQLWDNAERAQKFSMDGMKQEAASLGLNVDSFMQCIESHVELQKLKDDAAIANKFGIQGTPLILINGEQYDGAHSSDAFAQAFSQALSRVN